MLLRDGEFKGEATGLLYLEKSKTTVEEVHDGIKDS